jgi:sugar phosphate isomerase/epimerase
MHKIAFNTANLVARATGYRFELRNWGEQDRITRLKTDEKEWASICGEIAAAGFAAVEIWAAHLDELTESRAKTYRRILDDNGLIPVGLAGSLTDETARICGLMGLDTVNGGLWGSDLQTVNRLIASTALKYHYENHPEKSVEEILAKIQGGGPGVGLVIDTGWLGTAGVDAPAAIRALGKRLTHIHLKDVKAVGAHETVPLGTGAVNMAGVMTALRDIGYTGWYSWEDEPENRNPMEIAAEMRRWIEDHLQHPRN